MACKWHLHAAEEFAYKDLINSEHSGHPGCLFTLNKHHVGFLWIDSALFGWRADFVELSSIASTKGGLMVHLQWWMKNHYQPTSVCPESINSICVTIHVLFVLLSRNPTGSAATDLCWKTTGRRQNPVWLQHPERVNTAFSAEIARWYADLC